VAVSDAMSGLNCIERYAWHERTLKKPQSCPANRAHELSPLIKQASLNDRPLSLDALGQAPSAEVYRLSLIIGKMLEDPKRTLEVHQRLHFGMTVNYVGDDNCAGRAAENFTALAILKSNDGLAKDRKISSKATLGYSVNRSDCTASAGRALPKSLWIATATMLPRIIGGRRDRRSVR